jgi:cob(I)alamin adenosyltransferase
MSSKETAMPTHEQRMQKKQAVVQERIAAAQEQRGILLINTGNGKGKSSAAFGVLARALGHGLRAAVVQFVKGRSDTGEEAFFRAQPGVHWHVGGEGFTWETRDRERDARAAAAAWQIAGDHLANPDIDLVILDELTYAFKYDWLSLTEVLAALQARPAMQHVLITGRGAPPALRDIADTVTDMVMEKHAFKAGVKAMPGVEY